MTKPDDFLASDRPSWDSGPMLTQAQLDQEREDAERDLAAAVFTARSLMDPDEVQTIIDGANVEYEQFAQRRAEQTALLERLQQRRLAA